jgi:hypothetical protein
MSEPVCVGSRTDLTVLKLRSIELATELDEIDRWRPLRSEPIASGLAEYRTGRAPLLEECSSSTY